MKKGETLIKRVKGFTLIELMVVLGIIAALTAILVPSISGVMEKAYNAADAANAETICIAIRGECMDTADFYAFTTNPWPDGGASFDKPDNGYVYVDKKEVRVSSYKIAKVLEEQGFITSADAGTVRGSGTTPTGEEVKEYVYRAPVCSRMLCKSSKSWYRYQINIYDRDGTVEFGYAAVAYGTEGKNQGRNGSANNTQDATATKKFAEKAGGAPDYESSFGEASQ